jgi:hypothetical protein
MKKMSSGCIGKAEKIELPPHKAGSHFLQAALDHFIDEAILPNLAD